MRLRNKIFIISACLLVLALSAMTFLLPSIIKNKVIETVLLETGRKSRIGKISINPLTLRLSVQDLALYKTTGDADQFSIGEFDTSISIASLFKGALVLNELSITRPAISFTRISPNRYDFSDIVDLQAKKPKTEKKGDFFFSLANITIKQGSILFDDRVPVGGKINRIKELTINIPVISNMPHLVDTVTKPKLSAIVNGSGFTIDGETRPFSKSLETKLTIDIKQLNLPEYLGYLPVALPAKLASGALSIDSKIVYRVSASKKPELELNGTVKLEKIALDLKNGKPFIKIPSLDIRASKLDPFNNKYLFDSLIFDGLELFVSRNTSGEWVFTQLIPKPSATAKSAEKQNAKASGAMNSTPQIQIAAFGIHNSTVHFDDSMPTNRFASVFDQIDIDVKNISTSDGPVADYDISMVMDNRTDISLNGSFTHNPLYTKGSASIENLALERLYPYYSPFITAPLKGDFSCSTDVEYNLKGAIASKINLALSKFSTTYGNNEKFEFARFELKNGVFNQAQNQFEAALLKLSNGKILFSKESDGSLSLLSLIKRNEETLTKQQKQPEPANSNATSQKTNRFSWKIGTVDINRLDTTFTDKSHTDKPQFSLKNTNLVLSNMNGPVFTQSGLFFSSTLNNTTPLSAKGVLTPQPFRYKGNVTIGRLPLRDFESYFPDNINVFIVGGNAETSMDVDVRIDDGKPFGNYKGSAALRAFHAVDTKAEEDLLKWESLQLDDIQGSLNPFSLALHQIALNGVYSRIIIHKDGSLNLQNLIEKPHGKEAEHGDKKNLENSTVTQEKKQIKVDAITIQDGTLSFSDNHLPQHFETTFFNLGGRVSGLSSEDAKFADVDLRGNLENHSPLLITGKINPLRDDLFVDLKVSFRDIELSPITPYTATFLGYPVEKGKLFLDLKYLIDKKQLNSENKVFIDQFTLGEKVESDKATSLPVKLGLALLKDRNGEIHLDLPVTGRTDDPKFSIWGIVWQVVKNVLVKAATSPFSLLSSMFGGGAEDFSAIQFTPGSNSLSPAEEQKLTSLAKALHDRPALKMELKGYVDRERDTEGYRGELLNRKVRNEKILALSTQGTVITPDKMESVEIAQAEYPELLKAVYMKEKFPKPRNSIGVIKDLPPDEMRKLIIANTIIGDQELQTLARERVVTVFNHLINKGNIPIVRVFQKNEDIFKKTEKDSISRSRVEINAIAQ